MNNINALGVAQPCGDFNAILSGSKTTIFAFTDASDEHQESLTASTYYVYYDSTSGTSKLSSSYKSTKVDLSNYKNRMLSVSFSANLHGVNASGQTQIVNLNSAASFALKSKDTANALSITPYNKKVLKTENNQYTGYTTTTAPTNYIAIGSSSDGYSHGGIYDFVFYNTYDYVYITIIVEGRGESYNNVSCNISTAIVSWE